MEKVNALSYPEFLRTTGNRKRLVIVVTLGVFSQLSDDALINYYFTQTLIRSASPAARPSWASTPA
jgi:hypothetical protein